MNEERISKILEILNNEFSDDIMDDTIEIDGLKFSYSEESSHHSDKVTSALYGEDISFEREGRKEVSYERWVDTHWYDWE